MYAQRDLLYLYATVRIPYLSVLNAPEANISAEARKYVSEPLLSNRVSEQYIYIYIFRARENIISHLTYGKWWRERHKCESQRTFGNRKNTYKVNPSGSGNSTQLLQLLPFIIYTHRQKRCMHIICTHTRKHTRTLVSRRIIRISEIYKRQMQQID